MCKEKDVTVASLTECCQTAGGGAVAYNPLQKYKSLKLSSIRSVAVWQRAGGTAWHHLWRGPQSPRARVLLPAGAAGAESFEPPPSAFGNLLWQGLRLRKHDPLLGARHPTPRAVAMGDSVPAHPPELRGYRGPGRQTSKERGSSTVLKMGARRDGSLGHLLHIPACSRHLSCGSQVLAPQARKNV